MAFDVMSLLAASGMLPNTQRNAQPVPSQTAPMFNALLNDPQFQPMVPAAPVMPPPEPIPLGPSAYAAQPLPYGPPSGYDPMMMPMPYEQELYGSPAPMPLSSEAFGAPAPMAMPTGPVARPAINLPPIPPPGFSQRREPVMGFAAAPVPAQPGTSNVSAQVPRAEFEYPSMFDMFLAAQPGEDIAYNAPMAEGPAEPVQAAPKEEKDDELTSWQPGTGFTLKDPADKEGKRKIEVTSFTPTSQQGKGSAQIKTSRGTFNVNEESKFWPQIEQRHQALLGGYQQRASEGLPLAPSNQYGHYVTLEDGTKAPMMFDASGEMIVETGDEYLGTVRMDPTDVDPKSITYPIDPKTGKPDTGQYQAAIKAIGKGVTEPLQQTIQTAKGAVPSQRYSDPQTLSETTKFNISYDEFGLPKYSVVADPNYPPGFAQRLQADFDRDYKETRDAIQAELGFYLESGESIKDARLRQLRQEIDTLTPIAAGSSAAMTMAPGISADEATKSIEQKKQKIEEILKGGETIQLGNSVILQVGPAQTLTPIYNPTSWAAASARRRGMSTMAGNPESGAVLTPEQHGRFLVQSAVEPYVQQLGGMPPMTLTNESRRAIEATQGRINNIVNDAVGQYGKSGKLGVKAREAFANEPVTFTYKLGSQVIQDTMPLQQAVTEWRDAVQASQQAMATRSELEIIDAAKGLNSATRRFSGTIDVPYINGGTTYEPTREEKNLINALFQQQVIPQDMVSTPMTLSPDTRTVTQQQPIAGEIPRPPAGSTTPKGPPGVILPVFNLPTVKTDAGEGVGRMGVGSGSGILSTISNAPPNSNATIFWLKDNSPGVAAKSAKDNFFLAMHGDGNPAGLTTKRPDGTTQADDISAAVKATNKQMLTDSELRKAYARAFYDVLADLGYRDPNTSDTGFAADWEQVVLGRINEQAFINKYRTKLADKEFSDSKLGKQMALLSGHQKELKINPSAPESPMNLRLHQDVVAKIEQFARAGTLLGKGMVNGATNDGVMRLPTGHRIYFFPDPYDGAAQSFLGVPDIANGRIPSYPELTPEQAAAYASDPNNLPSILKTPVDLPGLHIMTGLQGGQSATAIGALIDVLVPKFQRDHPEIGANARINHGNSKDRRQSTNTKRIPDDEKKELNAAGVDAVYRAFVDVMINHAVLPGDRTVRKEGTGTPTIFKVPYR
jgi:hypothetical protein